jgi:hypothetical protein
VPGDDQALSQHAGVLGVVRDIATPKGQQLLAVERGEYLALTPPRQAFPGKVRLIARGGAEQATGDGILL